MLAAQEFRTIVSLLCIMIELPFSEAAPDLPSYLNATNQRRRAVDDRNVGL
jgi:hypothetical protein